MKIVIAAPFGSLSQESGVLYLLANYLKTVYSHVVQLRCNGIFSICEREILEGPRSIDSCARCTAHARVLSEWSGCVVEELSRYLAPEDVEQTRQWALRLNYSDFERARFQGIYPFEGARYSFARITGEASPEPNNKRHCDILRRLVVSSLRMQLAARRFNNVFRPDITLIAGGQEFITYGYCIQSLEQKRQFVSFEWDFTGRCLQVRQSNKGGVARCELLVDNVSSMRSDPRTWPLEITSVLDEILEFVDIPMAQLSLPIAQ